MQLFLSMKLQYTYICNYQCGCVHNNLLIFLTIYSSSLPLSVSMYEQQQSQIDLNQNVMKDLQQKVQEMQASKIIHVTFINKVLVFNTLLYSHNCEFKSHACSKGDSLGRHYCDSIMLIYNYILSY